MKTPKAKTLYNLVLLRKEGDTVYHDATLEWNKPYSLVKWMLHQAKNDPRRQFNKGQFLYPVPNSKDALDYYRIRTTKRKKVNDQKL